MKTISIIGGGSSAHALIPFLSKANYKINLLTSSPTQWSNLIDVTYILPDGEPSFTIHGSLDLVSDNPSLIIPNADIIIFCMPVHKYRIALARIAPYINKTKKVFLGTIYGQGGFNWMANEVISKYDLHNISVFAIGLIPWICRTNVYGKSGIVYGSKAVNFIAMSQINDFNMLNDEFLTKICFDWFDKGLFNLVDNFISLTLSVDNQIIHPSRLFGLYQEFGGKWNEKDDVPYFYRDYSENSAGLLKELDDDYSLIRQKIISIFPNNNFTYMLNYLELEHISYKSVNSDVLESFLNSQTLGAITTPVIYQNNFWIFDKNHRFFHDDIYYGLCIAKWFSEQLIIPTPTLDKILLWAQNILGEKLLENNKLAITKDDIKGNQYKFGIPSVYGYKEIREVID